MENFPTPSRDSTINLTNRPVSRRGLRATNNLAVENTQSMDQSQLAPLRPITGSLRNLNSGRPPSSGRIGTATRLASAMSSSGRPPTTASGNRLRTATLGYVSNMIVDRPITQHGLSGLPTSQGRTGTGSEGGGGGMRMVKDKRYWQAVLQTKINEIQQETLKLVGEKSQMDREQSAKRMYDRKVKEAAKELTNLQAKLTDMNIALDSFGSGTSRQRLQKEATALREHNEVAQNQLEHLFGEKQLADEKNKQLEREIEIEKNKIKDMILSLPIPEQARYSELQSLAEDFKEKNLEMQTKIDILNVKKERLNNHIMASDMRLEAARLHSKLIEHSSKMEALKEEQDNKLTPEQEREKLIREVRANNQALTSISHQMKFVEDQLNEKKEQLQLVEQDLEEGNSERHAKYKELKRRDETMTIFLDSFPQQMEDERKNLLLLKNQITYVIEQITLQGINLKSFGLNNSDLLNEKNDLTDQGGLLKEYKHLSIQIKQLQILEKKTGSQLKQLMEEEAELINEIRNYSNVEALRSEAAENMEELTSRLADLRKKRKVTEDVVTEAQKRNLEIKEHLRNNEAYKQIAHFEEKLVNLIRENKTLEEVFAHNRTENDYTKVRSEVQVLTQDINKMLLEEKKAP